MQTPGRTTLLLQVSAQVLALISQHATNGECEKTSYDDFYIEVVPDGASLRTAETWMPSADHIVHVIGGTSFGALPAVLKCAVQVTRSFHFAGFCVLPVCCISCCACYVLPLMLYKGASIHCELASLLFICICNLTGQLQVCCRTCVCKQMPCTSCTAQLL